LACVAGWLLYMAIVPDGKIGYVYDFGHDNFFIGKLTPAERVEPPAGGGQKIIGEPVYFSLRTPRRFDQAKVTIKYRRANGGDTAAPVIEAGVLADKTIWRYDLKPVDNGIIDRLAADWSAIREGDTLLLERNHNYDSVSEFLSDQPPRGEIALYNYDLNGEYLIPGYAAKTSVKTIDYPLRGAYQLYTYIKDEPLDFDFSFVDLNLNKDPDPIELNLYYRDQLIDSRRLDDDGITGDIGEKSAARNLRFNLANLPEGAYKIELRANNDIVTEKIATRQSKIAFINKFWLDNTGKPDMHLTVYTDSSEVRVQTSNPANLQTVIVGDESLRMDKTYTQYAAKTNSTSTAVVLERDDLLLAGDGVFAFSPEALINPAYKKVNDNLDVDRAGIDYILADYVPPRQDGDWQTATVDFDLTHAYREDGKYSFILSIPGMAPDDGLVVDEIMVELEGKGLVEKIRNMMW